MDFHVIWLADVTAILSQFEGMSDLHTLCLTGPDTMLARIIGSIIPPASSTLSVPSHTLGPVYDDIDYNLPSLKHLEVKLTNGIVCDPILKGPQHHCHCSVERDFRPVLSTLLERRSMVSIPLDYAKLSRCLVGEASVVKGLVKKVEFFKCRCLAPLPEGQPAPALSVPSPMNFLLGSVFAELMPFN